MLELPAITVENNITVKGPSGDIIISNNDNGLYNIHKRLNVRTPAGIGFARYDEPGNHYQTISPDWYGPGDWWAFFDSQQNMDWGRWYFNKGSFAFGKPGGPNTLLNDVDVLAELAAMKDVITQQQARIVALEKQLPQKALPNPPQ